MSALLWRSSWRWMARHPQTALLPLLGIALGVAAVVAVDLAKRSSQRGFEIASETVVGRATHQIVGSDGELDEHLYARLRLQTGLRDIAPVVEGEVWLGGRAVRLLGVDPLAEAPFRPHFAAASRGVGASLAVWLTEPGAVVASRALGLAIDERVEASVDGRAVWLRVVGEVAPQAGRESVEFLLCDVSTAQELLGQLGRLSHIDLRLPPGSAGVALREQIARDLPDDAILLPASRHAATAREMTRAFRINLTALSLLALLVGSFLIYNALMFSVVSRRPLMGRLRAVGVTRRQLLAMVLTEAGVLGALGSALGLVGGIALGRGILAQVTRTLNDLYFAVQVRGVSISAESLITGATLGVVFTLLAALPPALEATSVTPREALMRSALEQRRRRRLPAAVASGLIAMIVGVLVLLASERQLILSFAALFAVLIGFTLTIPALTWAAMRVCERPLRRVFGPVGSIAARSLTASLSRTGVAIAALSVAVSAVAGIGLMVHSFRLSVDAWLDRALFADLFVSAASRGGGLPEEVVGRLARLPDVEAVSTSSFVRMESSLGRVLVAALEMDQRHFESLQLLEGEPDATWSAFVRDDAVLISETLAHRHALSPGDEVELLTSRGMHPFRIAGTLRDYASDRGALRMSRATYGRHWDDGRVGSVGLDLTPDAEPERVREQIQASLPAGLQVNINSNDQIQRAALSVFDRTFAVTRALRAIAVCVAFAGVLAALLSLALDRARELAVLRAVGLVPSQLRRVVHLQTALMGALAGLLAIPLGIALALALIRVINKRSFGWTLDTHLSPELLAQAFALSLAAALLAGAYPARRLARPDVYKFLRDE